MSFNEDVRPVLVAISNLTRDDFGSTDGDALVAELVRMGHPKPTFRVLRNLLFHLRDDGFVKFHIRGGSEIIMVELDTYGRQEVEGWPAPGQVSTAALGALVAALTETANDESLPEEQRSKLREAAKAVGGFAVNVSAEVAGAWAAKMTGA
jgi:hypothetical protein